MKDTFKRILAFLLAALCAFATLGCRKEEHLKEGITLQPNAPYSEETMLYAKQTFLSLMEAAYSSASGIKIENISPTIRTRLEGYSARVCAITVQKTVVESQYLSMLDTISRDGKAVIDELLALRAGESTEWGSIRNFYLDLTAIFGSEYVASMFYDICAFIYDAKYDLAMERYEKNPYPWYLEEAETWATEKAIFLASVERTAFSALIRCGVATFELFSNGFASLPDAFSDAELLQIVKTLDLEDIVMERAGWSILLSYTLPKEEPLADAPYFVKLRYAVRTSGDYEKLADVMDEMSALALSVTQKMIPTDMQALRTGDYEALANSVFSRFSDADWDAFNTLTSIALSNEQYHALATAEYGASYSEYLASLQSVTFEELRQSLGTEDFYSDLLHYLAGICPAISYEVNK